MTQGISVVTLSTRSHLPQAVTAMRSLTSKSKNFERRIYLIGISHLSTTTTKDGIVITPLPLSIIAEAISNFQSDYSLAEICFALKPLLLRHELQVGMPACIYIDSDLHFYSSIENLISSTLNHSVCLTPHYLTPVTEGASPSSLSLLRAGLYNGGYISVSNDYEAHKFLNWWSLRVAKEGYNEPKLGMCGDQRWLDLVPVLFKNVHIILNPGVNVAYWNLYERKLAQERCRGITVNGERLVFFHFSGINLNHDGGLTRFQYTPTHEDPSLILDLQSQYRHSVQKNKAMMSSQFKLFNSCNLMDSYMNNRPNRWKRKFKKFLTWKTC